MPPNQLRRGALADWSPPENPDSMARAIEVALADHFGPFPPVDPTERRQFCLAISHGVLNYLAGHPEALRVTVTIGGVDVEGRVTSIAVI